MKRIRLFLAIIAVTLLPGKIFAQATTFDGDGKLTSLNYGKRTTANVTPNYISVFNNAGLSNESKEKKEAIRKIIIAKIDDAIAKLGDNNEKTTKLLKEVWTVPGDVSAIKKDLETFKKILEDDALGNPSFTTMGDIKTPITNNLLSSSSTLYTVEPATGSETNKTKLWEKDAFNQFVIDYYTATLTDPAIKNLTLTDLQNIAANLATEFKMTDELCKKIYESEELITMTLLGQIQAFTISLHTAGTQYSKCKILLNKDWFKEWFWIKGGELKLNPLDFSTDEFLAKFPEYDISKGKIFEDYIIAVIEKYKLYDTTGKVEQFKKILAMKGTGNEQFKMKERQSMIEAYNKAKTNQLTTKSLLNQVEIPKEDKFYSYSATGDFESDDNDKKYLISGAREGEVKTIVVHNIPDGSKADITETSKAIKDRSAFQQGVDSLAGLIGEIAGYTTSLGIPANIIGKLFNDKKTPNGVIGVAAVNVNSGIMDARGNPAPPMFSLKDYIKQFLIDKDTYEPGSFNATYSSLYPVIADIKFKISDLLPGAIGSPAKVAISNFLSEYYKRYYIYQQAIIIKLQTDSLVLAEMITIFANSTLPPKKLEAKTDKTPAFYSKIISTEPADDPSERKVNVFSYTVKDADTSKIASFKYKTGKKYLIQLSAGLAYTTSNFIQSSAKEENGQITITNNAQQLRLTVGVHLHLGKGLFLQDNSCPGKFWERSSVYLGVGIPKPLDNIYFGYSYDLVPGLKTIIGAHFYKNDKYTIQNNTITDKRLRYNTTGPFLAIQIDPTSILKALNLIKN